MHLFYSEAHVGKYHSTHKTAQTQNLDEYSFDMLYKNKHSFLTQYEQPMYHMKGK